MPQPRKPKLGQNFLVDDSARHRIADSLGDLSTRTVVEIGPGHGAITDILAPRAKRLICIELDRALAAELTFRFRDQPHVQVLHADVLTTDLTALNTTDTVDVIGNLPYYITSDILLHLFASARSLRRAVLMMQREVADRVAAQPGVRDYGLLSVTTQLYAEVENLFTLPPTAFNPPPEVHSSVLRLNFNQHLNSPIPNYSSLVTFFRICFAQKRKTLPNNLRSAGYSAETLATLWPAVIPQQARAEQLPVEHLLLLFAALSSAPVSAA